MAMESTILGKKSPLTNFQKLTQQISLLAGLHTWSILSHYKTQKQHILRHLRLFPMYFKFHPNFYAEALRLTILGSLITV